MILVIIFDVSRVRVEDDVRELSDRVFDDLVSDGLAVVLVPVVSV